MSNSVTTRRSRVSLLGGVSLLTLLCSGAVAEPLLPAIDIGGQQTPDSGAANPPAQGAPSAQPAAGAAQPTAQPLGDWPGASNATPTLFDGSAAAGYRVKETTAAGPIWGDLPLQDAPYSITVVPSAFIENLQAYQPEDVWKVIPQITNNNTQQNRTGNPFAYVRGFSITQFTNGSGVVYDGLLGGAGGEFNTVMEDKERVELLSGVSGFLYGTGSVGGVLNNVLKRPTATTYNSVTAGDNAGANGYVHGDFGGPLKVPGIRDDLFGYRLNLVYQGGDTSIPNQSVKRNLESAAFDIHLWDGALLQLNGAHSFYYIDGLSPGFAQASLSPPPAAPNPLTVGTPPWLRFSEETENGGFKFTWKLNDMFTWRTAYDYTNEGRQTQMSATTSVVNDFGQATATTGGSAGPNYWHTHSGYSFLDAELSTFGVQHKLTAGFTGFTQFINGGGDYQNIGTAVYKNIDIYNIYYVPEPSIYYTSNPYNFRYGNQFGKNFVVGDEIKYSNLTILAGANYTSIGNISWGSYNTPATLTLPSGYGAAQVTPTVAALYKILPWFTVYASYQQSLQNGSDVQSTATTVYTNSGQILPPYLSQQLEFGAKATIGKNLLVTAALFDIDKANQYTQSNPNGTYTVIQSGREDHKGLELTMSGKATEDLTLFAGLTLLNPRITNDPVAPWQNGQLAQYVSPVSGKIYAEYSIPYLAAAPFLQGLVLIGAVRFASEYAGSLPSSYANVPYIQKYPAYSTGDIGVRYQTRLYDKDVVFRFNMNNVTNTAYWEAGSSLGPPRTFLATMQVKF